MQSFKIYKALAITISLLISFPVFSMNDQKQPCSICGKVTHLQTMTTNKPTTIWRSQVEYEPIINSLDSPNQENSTTNNNNLNTNPLSQSGRQGTTPRSSQRQGSPGVRRAIRPSPTYQNKQCTHLVCAECIDASVLLEPDDKHCYLCPYASAYAQHAQCNVQSCENPTKHITKHINHTHGLCDQHTIEIRKLNMMGCKICYAQDNPLLEPDTACETCENNADTIYVKQSCRHDLCTECKTESNSFYPSNGCKICTYVDAKEKHVTCNIDTCDNEVDRISSHGRHTHGLCNQHRTEIETKFHGQLNTCLICYAKDNFTQLKQEYAQCELCENKTDHYTFEKSCKHYLCDTHNQLAHNFQYSPFDRIKNALQGNPCNACFIKKNPEVTSCFSKKRYWGETALLIGAAAIVLYGAKKVYEWWQDKNKKQAEKNIQEDDEKATPVLA